MYDRTLYSWPNVIMRACVVWRYCVAHARARVRVTACVRQKSSDVANSVIITCAPTVDAPCRAGYPCPPWRPPLLPGPPKDAWRACQWYRSHKARTTSTKNKPLRQDMQASGPVKRIPHDGDESEEETEADTAVASSITVATEGGETVFLDSD